jgi:hypothetical protein
MNRSGVVGMGRQRAVQHTDNDGARQGRQQQQA